MDKAQPANANPEVPPENGEEHGIAAWLKENVAKPFVSGTGVLQVASNFTEKPLTWQSSGPTNTAEWVTQTFSSGMGALALYVPIGKATGGALGLLGRGADRGLIAAGAAEGLPSAAARFMANNSTGQILGAGLYDASKAPGEGETRSGNSIASMAGFTVFEFGNKGLHLAAASPTMLGAKNYLATNLGETFTRGISATGIGLGRYSVGALGGAVSYETAHAANALITGDENKATLDGLKDSIASAGFMNVALPVVQRAGTKVIDKTINSPEWGRGVPIGRQLNYSGFNDPELSAMAAANPLARVKAATDGVTRADVQANVVHLADKDGPGRLAHEMRHLQIARQVEPEYRRIADLLPTDKAAAEEQFYQLRSYIESEARMAEDRVNSRTAKSPGEPNAPTPLSERLAIFQQRAANGRTYGDIWKEEWQRFQDNPGYRPRLEFEGAPEAADQAVDMHSPIWGSPEQLGANLRQSGEAGVNFAVYAPDATQINLWLFDHPDSTVPSQALPMFKTGDVWHRFVPEAAEGNLYLFNADGPYDPANGKRVNRNIGLLDPYSRAITGDTKGPLGYDNSNPDDPQRDRRMGTDNNLDKLPRSVVIDPNSFDWGNDQEPNVSLDQTVILEVNVSGITKNDPGVPEKLRGTYAGLAEKIPWLKNFGEEGRKGVTTLQIMPTMEFDFDDFGRSNPLTGRKLLNSWGYNTVGFMAPEHNYSSGGSRGEQVNEFKNMVKTAHENGMEVILDIVLNHTREGNEQGPTIHLKGLSNEQMYMLRKDNKAYYENHSGTGNTIGANQPAGMRFVLDTLRYWANEMRVDGFRFDLGSTFKFDGDGYKQFKTAIMEAIESDPVLSKLKLIAEPWTAGTSYDRGSFSDRIWMEQDGHFRDVVRKYVKGDNDQLAPLVELVKGSPAQFDRNVGRRPNTFVVYHDGFLSRDIVSYNDKHNFENAEENRDGDNNNNSWNTGFEGPVKNSDLSDQQKQQIEDLRMQLMKNKMALLLMSQGVPTIYYLDLFGQSAEGNNNIWAQPEKNALRWDMLSESPEFFDFTRYLVDLRRRLNIGAFGPSMPFHGSQPYKPDLGGGMHFLGFTYPGTGTAGGQALHIYSNMWWADGVSAKLPDRSWLLTDTSHKFSTLPSDLPRDRILHDSYVIGPRSLAIFATPAPGEAKP